tara:strand:+ start:690 stop:854 length:165 start_codon:yes stop_codon:yes gene_type:complete
MKDQEQSVSVLPHQLSSERISIQTKVPEEEGTQAAIRKKTYVSLQKDFLRVSVC